MTRFVKFAAVAIAGAILSAPQVATTGGPTFPIILDGVDCVGSYCYNTVWTLESDGTFIESYGLNGTYVYNPNYGNQGGLIIMYDPSQWPYEYLGARTGTCLSGPARDLYGTIVGTFDACIA